VFRAREKSINIGRSSRYVVAVRGGLRRINLLSVKYDRARSTRKRTVRKRPFVQKCTQLSEITTVRCVQYVFERCVYYGELLSPINILDSRNRTVVSNIRKHALTRVHFLYNKRRGESREFCLVGIVLRHKQIGKAFVFTIAVRRYSSIQTTTTTTTSP